MDFPKFQRLVEERTGFRTMENPTASGEYFSDSCGDMYNFFLKVGPGAVIEDISYFTTGCGFGTATCSLVVELAKGKTIDEAGAITPPRSRRCSTAIPRRRKIIPSARSRRCTLRIDDYRGKVASGRGSGFCGDAAPGGARGRRGDPGAARSPRRRPTADDGKLLIKLR